MLDFNKIKGYSMLPSLSDAIDFRFLPGSFVVVMGGGVLLA